MESLFSFPVGLLHPLQHAGLPRRSPYCRPTDRNARFRASTRLDECLGLNSSVEGDTDRTGHGLTHTAETAWINGSLASTLR